MFLRLTVRPELNDLVSSTNIVSFALFSFLEGCGNLMPLTFWLILIMDANGSACKMYTLGATGHPWWIDLEMLTYLDINRFVIIHVFAFLNNILTHFPKICPKFEFLQAFFYPFPFYSIESFHLITPSILIFFPNFNSEIFNFNFCQIPKTVQACF